MSLYRLYYIELHQTSDLARSLSEVRNERICRSSQAAVWRHKVFCQTLAGREWLCNSSWQLCLWVPFWDHPPCHPLPQQRSFSHCTSFDIHQIVIKFAWVSKNRNIFYFSDKNVYFLQALAHAIDYDARGKWIWRARKKTIRSEWLESKANSNSSFLSTPQTSQVHHNSSINSAPPTAWSNCFTTTTLLGLEYLQFYKNLYTLHLPRHL